VASGKRKTGVLTEPIQPQPMLEGDGLDTNTKSLDNPKPDSNLVQCEVCTLPIRKSDRLCEWCGAAYIRAKDSGRSCEGIVCTSCGCQNAKDKNKCEECGSAFSVLCPACKHEVLLNDSACPSCKLSFSGFSHMIARNAEREERRRIRNVRIGLITSLVFFVGLFFALLPSFFHEGIEWYDYFYPVGGASIQYSFVPILGLLSFVAVFLGLPILFLKGLLDTFKSEKKRGGVS
jgi:hypothetical protein